MMRVHVFWVRRFVFAFAMPAWALGFFLFPFFFLRTIPHLAFGKNNLLGLHACGCE